jgi:hypothetical protein
LTAHERRPGAPVRPPAPDLARISACAVGLAFAARDDGEALDELVDMAGGDLELVDAARTRLGDLAGVEQCVLRRADDLLAASRRRRVARDRPRHDADASTGDIVVDG